MYHSLLETSGHCETEANVRSICVGLCAYLPAVKKGPFGKTLYALCLAFRLYIKFNQMDLFYDTCQTCLDAMEAT